MPTLTDYLAWRGDLTFASAPMCEVDNLIFSLLSYVDFDGIVPPPGMGRITIREAAKEYFFVRDPAIVRPLGLIVPSDILALFRRLADTPRYRSLELCSYVSEICEEREMQFAAIAIRLPQVGGGEGLFAAFRGTDDTIVGWREDFNLSFMDEVPSQRKAAEYLDALDLPPDTALWVGGHSKGGNLAVWGAVHAGERVRQNLRRVWSNDGPGFSESMIRSEAYRTLSDRISILLPDDSLVGLLLEHDEAYDIVRSTGRGLIQHDALTWEVQGDRILRMDSLTRRARRTDTVVRDRIAAMTGGERATFVRLLFTVLESTGAKTLTDLHKAGLRTVLGFLRTVASLSREEQETGAYLIGKLFFAKELPLSSLRSISESTPEDLGTAQNDQPSVASGRAHPRCDVAPDGLPASAKRLESSTISPTRRTRRTRTRAEAGSARIGTPNGPTRRIRIEFGLRFPPRKPH